MGEKPKGPKRRRGAKPGMPKSWQEEARRKVVQALRPLEEERKNPVVEERGKSPREEEQELVREVVDRYKAAGLTEGQAALLAEMNMNGGNVSGAAKTIGMRPDYARYLANNHPLVKPLVEAMRKAPAGRLRRWGELAGRAQDKMEQLLECPDPRVAFAAAKHILDREEGTVVARTEDVAETRRAADPATLKAALALVLGAGMNMAQALEHVRKNPEEARQWLARGAGDALPGSVEPARGEEEPALPLVLPSGVQA